MEPFDMMFAAQSGHLNAVLGSVTFCDRSQTGSCSKSGFRSVSVSQFHRQLASQLVSKSVRQLVR